MWIHRDVEPLLLQRAATRPVVVLTGARQTGKTSLMRRLFPDHAFVTLDLPSEAEQAERDLGSFLARHPPPLIVDEVQYAPGLFRHLKAAVDRDRGHCGAFLLTGSQPLGLMKSVSDSLAGRAGIVELEPLSFAEAKAVHPNLTVEGFLVRSGFPELYQNLEIESEGSEIPSCVLLSLYFNKLIFIHLTILSFDNCAPNTAQWLARRRSTPSLSD